VTRTTMARMKRIAKRKAFMGSIVDLALEARIHEKL